MAARYNFSGPEICQSPSEQPILQTDGDYGTVEIKVAFGQSCVQLGRRLVASLSYFKVSKTSLSFLVFLL